MKITFLGAGSSVFVRNVLGDCILTPEISDATFALYDIDKSRVEESHRMMVNINANSNNNRAVFEKYVGPGELPAALQDADFVINAVQVGGYDPCTIWDFDIPKKYGLRQTIGDTLGVAGVFRALRTIPVMEQFAGQMERSCPNAQFLNYTNPMGILTGYMLRHTNIKTVGLCHSVQKCTRELLTGLGLPEDPEVQSKIAGINHMAWLLEISKDGRDLYPELKKMYREKGCVETDKVRFEIMDKFGYYVTESSEHNAEYMPYFIKSGYPELIDYYNVPLDEYPRRCIRNIKRWEDIKTELTENSQLTHEKSIEYAAYIIQAFITNQPYKFGGNVINNGMISNLPPEACVEVPCIADATGITPTYIGALPEQCAALNRTNLNVQLLAIEAAKTRNKEAVYHAAMLDPHTAAELPLDKIIMLCDDLFEAHKDWMPVYR